VGREVSAGDALAAIKTRAENATKGPWFAHQDFIDMGVEDATKTITNSPERYAGKFIASVGLDSEVKSANAELMTAAPRLLAALEAVLELHQEDVFRGHLSNGCKVCGFGEDGSVTCDTVKAIEEALS